MVQKAGAFVACLSALMTTQVVNCGLISEDNTKKTLVVVDDWATVETHSLFFEHMGKGKLGHEIEFAMAHQGA